MLENNLWSIKMFFWTVVIAFPMLWFAISYYLIIGDDVNTASVTLSIVGGVLAYLFFLFRYNFERRALENYLEALKDKRFDEALTYGRMYYGVKKHGMKGASGNYNTVDEEQMINNDIAAYQ